MLTRKPEIRSLTGIRGVAALFVMVYHLKIYAMFSGPLNIALRHGYLSVDLFFVLSGFVMALSYGGIFRRGARRESYWKFLSHRIARIYPLYGVLTVVAFAARHFGRHPVPKETLLANLLLVQAWGPGGYIVGPAWSLSTEWAAYLVFPALAVFCLATSRGRVVVVTVVCVSLLILLAVVPDGVSHITHYKGPMDMPDGNSYGPVLRCILEFSLGMLAWRASKAKWMSRVLSNSWASAAVLLAILALMPMARADLWIVLCFPVLVCFISTDKPPVARALCTPIAMWLGNISFSIFLLHTIIPIGKDGTTAWLTKHHVVYPEAIWAVTIFAVSLGLGTLTYEYIEKPGRTLLRSIFDAKLSGPSIVRSEAA